VKRLGTTHNGLLRRILSKSADIQNQYIWLAIGRGMQYRDTSNLAFDVNVDDHAAMCILWFLFSLFKIFVKSRQQMSSADKTKLRTHTASKISAQMPL
jgi:hypothetical protein